jgi:hypothetical protein
MGTGNDKALEIYNPTNNPIDLSLYSIKRYSNGATYPTSELPLSGTIQPKDVVVVTNGQTDSVWVTSGGGYWSPGISEVLYNLGDLHGSGVYPTPMYFNGDDALTLETATGPVDIFGKIGQQPENGWNDIPPTYVAGTQFWTSWSVDHTLIRKHSVKHGVTAIPAIFMINMEWDSLPINVFDSLRSHRCDCGSTGIWEKNNVHSFVMYPNPVTGNTLRLNTTDDISSIEIRNTLGQMIRRQDYSSIVRDITFEVGDLIQGMYMIEIYYRDKTTAVQKFIKR